MLSLGPNCCCCSVNCTPWSDRRRDVHNKKQSTRGLALHLWVCLRFSCSPVSQHFYQNKLQDAPAITAAPDEPFYKLQLLKPYVFFDVSRGTMARGRGGTGPSMGNQVTDGHMVS